MFKSFQDTSNQSQFKSFPNLNMQQATSAYGFSGVTFWLDAAYGLNTQTNLGAVSSWQSRLGGITFTQTTAANQPRLILNDANFNNLPSIDAHDTNRFMNANFPIGFNSDITILWVSKTNTLKQADTILASNQPSWAILLNSGTDNPNITGSGIYSSSGTFTGTTELTTPKISVYTNNNIIVNGNSQRTGTAIASYSAFDQLFRYSSQAYNGILSLAELIIFNNKLSNTDMLALSDRINQKYAIY